MTGGPRDWDVRLPDLALHAAPVALALFCLVLSQANAVVFWGFEEDEPATTLSTLLMGSCLVIALAGARRPDLPLPLRRVGSVLALLAGVAVLDENLLWHEAIGKYVQSATGSRPGSLAWYTDDVVVLLAAIVGGFIVYRCIRYVSRACESPEERRPLFPYFACTVAFALAHGTLDIVGHSHYVVDRVLPHLSESAANDYVQRISYFEEACKLWTEWFVVLLLLKLLHRQRGSLAWSLLAAIGSGLALPGGLWGVDDAGRGIPCLTTGEPLAFLRNFHSLFALAWIWTAWSIIGWIGLRPSLERRQLSGALLVVPLAPLLGGLIDPDRLGHAIATVAHAILPDAYYGASVTRHGLLLAALVIPGVAAGLAAGQLIKRWPMATGMLFVLVCTVLSPWRFPSLASGVLIGVTGSLVVVARSLADQRREAGLTLAVLTVALFAGSGWWTIGALGWAVVTTSRDVPETWLRHRAAVLLAIAVLQFVVLATLTLRADPRFLPNYEWAIRNESVFDVTYQPFENPLAAGVSDAR